MPLAATARLALALGFALASASSQASPLGPDGVRGRVVPGKFVWFDLATEDVAGARAFYGSVFGWKFRETHSATTPYTLVEHPGGGKVGGIVRQSRPAGAPVGARWLSVSGRGGRR